MGGSGSGYTGPVARTVEQARGISVNRWVHEGIIKPCCTVRGTWQWSNARTGEVTARIGYAADTMRSAHVVLSYSANDVPITTRVELTTTRPYFGGVRWWFVCPECGRRAGWLYLVGQWARFACRTCRRLTYTSCQESHRWDALGRRCGINPQQWRQLQRYMGS